MAQHPEHLTMPSAEESLTLGSYYQYLCKLVDSVLTNSPHPEGPPDGYESWAGMNGKPRNIHEARTKYLTPQRPPATFANPNGNVQWMGSHFVPGSTPPIRPQPYAYPAYIPPPPLSTGLMSSDEFFQVMQRCRDYNRAVIREEAERYHAVRIYRGGSHGRTSREGYRPYNRDHHVRGSSLNENADSLEVVSRDAPTGRLSTSALVGILEQNRDKIDEVLAELERRDAEKQLDRRIGELEVALADARKSIPQSTAASKDMPTNSPDAPSHK